MHIFTPFCCKSLRNPLDSILSNNLSLVEYDVKNTNVPPGATLLTIFIIVPNESNNAHSKYQE